MLRAKQDCVGDLTNAAALTKAQGHIIRVTASRTPLSPRRKLDFTLGFGASGAMLQRRSVCTPGEGFIRRCSISAVEVLG